MGRRGKMTRTNYARSVRHLRCNVETNATIREPDHMREDAPHHRISVSTKKVQDLPPSFDMPQGRGRESNTARAGIGRVLATSTGRLNNESEIGSGLPK